MIGSNLGCSKSREDASVERLPQLMSTGSHDLATYQSSWTTATYSKPCWSDQLVVSPIDTLELMPTISRSAL